MADHADDGDGDIFVYRGGRAPRHVTHVLIDKSVDEIEEEAFSGCQQLLQVDTHDGLTKIGRRAFSYCTSLPRISLKSVFEIENWAFYECNLESVEFGDRLLSTKSQTTISHCHRFSCIFHLHAPFDRC